jgi:hypothetical protein
MTRTLRQAVRESSRWPSAGEHRPDVAFGDRQIDGAGGTWDDRDAPSMWTNR